MIRKDKNGVYEIFHHGSWRLMSQAEILETIGKTHHFTHSDCCHKFYQQTNNNISTETL